MNSSQIFTLALGISEPWYVKEILFDKPGTQSAVLNIHIDFKKGSKFDSHSVHDTVERKWQHLNIFEHNCYIHARVPRIILEDGSVKTIEVPWARKNSGFTLLFEAYSMLLIESEMPVNKASKVLRVNPHRLWNVFTYWIKQAHEKDSIEGLTMLGFDETSTRKGHNYVTTAVDLEKKRVIFATEGKSSSCIAECAEYLESKNLPKDEIKQVCIDMSPAFISGCLKQFKKAKLTFDRFHVCQLINKAMDELRKGESQEIKMFNGYRYIFLKKHKNLSDNQAHDKDEMMTLYPKLGEGYRLKELFNDFWEMKDKEQAEAYLTWWCDQVKDSGIQPFIKAANMIQAHWTGIVNYIESRISNGVLESINAKIQQVKRRAKGYRNINNFIQMIYFICGKLKFDYPLYST